MQDIGAALLGLVFVAAAAALYFLPAWVAASRRHHNAGAIFALNLLLGWTFLGWAAALVWALTAVRPELRAPAPTSAPPKPRGPKPGDFRWGIPDRED